MDQSDRIVDRSACIALKRRHTRFDFDERKAHRGGDWRLNSCREQSLELSKSAKVPVIVLDNIRSLSPSITPVDREGGAGEVFQNRPPARRVINSRILLCVPFDQHRD